MKRIYKGDIFYANLGKGNGGEIGGSHVPVIVLQNNINNVSCKTVIVAPISEKLLEKDKQASNVVLKQFEYIRPGSLIMLEQIRVIDKSRLKGRIGMLNEEQWDELHHAIKWTFDMDMSNV